MDEGGEKSFNIALNFDLPKRPFPKTSGLTYRLKIFSSLLLIFYSLRCSVSQLHFSPHYCMRLSRPNLDFYKKLEHSLKPTKFIEYSPLSHLQDSLGQLYWTYNLTPWRAREKRPCLVGPHRATCKISAAHPPDSRLPTTLYHLGKWFCFFSADIYMCVCVCISLSLSLKHGFKIR